jgi:hypothetical protein
MEFTHDIDVRAAPPKSLLCVTCGEAYTSRDPTKIHFKCRMRRKCRFCDYRTFSGPVLIEHERTHTGNYQVCRRVSDPDPDWIRIQSDHWIRIRIHNMNTDPDPGGQK